jgi:Zn-dependent protease with chaperone function
MLAIVVVSLRVGEYGPWRGIDTWEHRLGPIGVTAVALGLLAVGAATIALLAWAGQSKHILRRAHARLPRPGEADRAQLAASNFAIGVGLPAPRLRIVDDDAVNALASGRRGAPEIVLTSGALRLAPDELDALCAHTVTCVAQRACALAGAAAGVVLDADWCTRTIWGIAAIVFVSGLVGVPTEAIAIAILGIMALVVITKPLVGLASRAIVGLLERTAELADLETVRVTNQPEALAKLMLDTVEVRAPMQSTWDIAHLWFDPETEPRSPSTWYPNIRPLAGPQSRRTRAALVERARVLVDLCGADQALHARLEHAARTVAASHSTGD